MRALRWLLLTAGFFSLCVPGARGQAQAVSESDSVEFMQHAPMSAEGAQALEATLKANPDDRIAHIRLMGYYWSQATFYNRADVRRSLVEQADWFAVHEPQSVVLEMADFNLKQSDFAAPHADDWTHYRGSWLDAVKRNQDNTAVLLHALRATQAVDLDVPFFCERRLRVLMPTYPQYAVGLAGLYIRIIEIQLKRNDGVSSAFTQLMASGDAAVMGLAGQAVVASSKLSGKPDPMDSLGPQLLKKAHELDPSNARWSDALNAPAPASMDEIVTALNTLKQEDLWPGGKVTGMMVPATALKVDASEQAAKLISPNADFLKNALGTRLGPGEVSLLALVGPDGHVQQTQFDSGSVRHFHQAMSMVRSWQYTPAVVDGRPVPVVTKIDLKFTAPQPLPASGVAGMGGMGFAGGIMGGIGTAPTPVGSVPASGRSGPMRISAGVTAGNKIAGDSPVYPPLAKAAHISGAVILHAIISKTGEIEDVTVISGPDMLRASALTAVRTWKYKPFLLAGKPTEVETMITVNFNFGKGPAAAPPGATPGGSSAPLSGAPSVVP